MVTRLNNAEGGTNGATVTQGSGGNSGGGSGDFFNVVSIGTGAGFIFDNAQPQHGALAYKISHASGTATTAEWTGLNSASIAVREYIEFDTLPSVAGFRPIDIRTVGGISIGRIIFNASGQMIFQTNGGATTLKTWTTAVTTLTTYRIEVAVTTGNASNATLKADIYSGDSTTPLEAGFSTTTGSTGATDNVAQVRWGSGAGIAATFAFWFDDLGASEGTTTYIGPVTTAAASGAVAKGNATAVAPGLTAGSGVSGGGPATATAQALAPMVLGFAGVGVRATVLLDDGSGSFSTAISSRVDLRSGLSITRGRGDQFEQVQPATLSMTLDNRDGALTTGPNPLRINQPVKVLLSAGSVVSPRFTGYITEWSTVWPNGMDRQSLVQVTASDDFARLNRRTYRTLLEEIVLTDKPAYYYTMGEPQGSKAAADTSGNGNRPLVLTGSGAAVEFGDSEGGPPTGGTAAKFGGGQFLRRTIRQGYPTVFDRFGGGETSMTLTVSAVVNPTAAGNIVAIGDDLLTALLEVAADGRLTARFRGTLPSSAGGVGAATSPDSVLLTGVRHVAATFTAYATRETFVRLYLDGVDVGSVSLDPAIELTSLASRVTVGADGYQGTISNVAVWTPSVSHSLLERHTIAAMDGFTYDTSRARVGRLADFAGFPATKRALAAGSLTETAAQDIQGVTPIEAMQRVAETEGGLLFMAGWGTLTLQSRHHRAKKTSPDWTLTAHDLGRDTAFVGDLQGLVNYAVVTRPNGEQQVVQNVASQVDHGRVEVTREPLVTSDEEALDLAHWLIHNHSAVAPRVPDVTIDLITQPAEVQEAWLFRTLSDRLRVTGLPGQTPQGTTADLIIEGWTETVTDQSWDVTLNLTPFATEQAWVLEDAALSVLGTTTRPTY